MLLHLRLALMVVCTGGSLVGFAKVELFRSGSGGYAHYRIPGIVATPRGTLLAYAEARRSGAGDWKAIDIVLRRSVDGGATWTPQQVIAQVDGPKVKNPVAVAHNLSSTEEVTYNNPVAIADKKRGVVHFLFCLEYMRAFYMRSEDDGVTFAKPVEVTATFDAFRGEYDWKVLATGPGHGIQLRNGRLLVPVWLSTGTGGNAHHPSVTATIYSDDGGQSWKRGEIAIQDTEVFRNPNETVAVELQDGTVMLNARTESTWHRRVVVTSKDGATGWTAPRFDRALLEPICFGSILAVGKRRLVFANPDQLDTLRRPPIAGKPRDRRNLTVQFSEDDGRTWTAKKVVEPRWSGYSDLAAGRGGRIYLFYEQGVAEAESFRMESLVFTEVEWPKKRR